MLHAGNSRSSTYVGESESLIRQFKKYYSQIRWDDSTVLHDAGNAFKSNGEYFLKEEVYLHIVYPSCIH